MDGMEIPELPILSVEASNELHRRRPRGNPKRAPHSEPEERPQDQVELSDEAWIDLASRELGLRFGDLLLEEEALTERRPAIEAALTVADFEQRADVAVEAMTAALRLVLDAAAPSDPSSVDLIARVHTARDATVAYVEQHGGASSAVTEHLAAIVAAVTAGTDASPDPG